MHVLRFA